MKYTQLSGLEKHLVQAAPDHLCPIYLVVAEDGYDRWIAVQRIARTVGRRAQKLEGEGLTTKELAEELNTFPLFSSHKFIRVEGLDQASSAIERVLQDYCNNPNPRLYLVLVARRLSAKKTLYKAIEKAGVIFDLPSPPPWEKERVLLHWLTELVVIQGKVLAPQAANRLLEHLGDDKQSLALEIDKLCTYVGERKAITADDVAALLPTRQADEVVWELGRAVLQREPRNAMHQLERLLAMPDATPYGVVAQLRRQLHTAFQVGSLVAGGKGPQEVTALFPYMKGRVLTTNIQQARTYGVERFQRAMVALGKIDLRMKNESVSPALLLQRLVVELACL